MKPPVETGHEFEMQHYFYRKTQCMVSAGSHMVQTDSSSCDKGVVFIMVGSKQLHKI